MKAVSVLDVAPRRWLGRAAALSAIAGMIHMLMAPIYFSQWIGYGAFFFAAASTQLLYTMLLVVFSPNRTLLWVGVVGTAAAVALWLVTRTIGIPFFGPEAGEVQRVGAVDLITQLVQVALIVHLVALLRIFPHLEPHPLIE